jgi:2'-5' RNA ligase
MTFAASVGSHERLRLFCALTLPEEVLDRIVDWQQRELPGGGRIVRRANLHVTLAFLGARPAADVERVSEALREAAGAVRRLPTATALRYRETRSVGMLVLDDENGGAAALARDLHARLEALGLYQGEARSWLAHLTVLRFSRAPGLRPQLPGLGTFSPSGAAVYHSVLRRDGAEYQVLKSFALGG